VSSVQARQFLESGAIQLGLSLNKTEVDRLANYLQLFEKWNRTFNLSAIRDPMEMVKLHLLDSLAIAPLVEGHRFIDVGTGGGLPGIPLAIVNPDKHFVLLDSAGKKTRFLFQVKQALGLDNVEIINDRVENYCPDQQFEAILSRAFASLKDMVAGCEHLLASNGRFWAMKGQYPTDEIEAIKPGYAVDRLFTIDVPGLDADRCLLSIKVT